LIARHQDITRKWWNTILPALDPFISQFVLTEKYSDSREDTLPQRGFLQSQKRMRIILQ
jgi:hypothetical protein